MYVRPCVFVRVCTSVCVHVRLCIPDRVCTSVCVRPFVCPGPCVSVRVCTSVCTAVCVSRTVYPRYKPSMVVMEVCLDDW